MLIKWATHFSPKPSRVFVIHGDSEVCDLFTKRLQDEFGLAATSPYSGSIYDLAKNAYDYESRPMPLAERVRDQAPERERTPEPAERTEPELRDEPRKAQLKTLLQQLKLC